MRFDFKISVAGEEKTYMNEIVEKSEFQRKLSQRDENQEIFKSCCVFDSTPAHHICNQPIFIAQTHTNKYERCCCCAVWLNFLIKIECTPPSTHLKCVILDHIYLHSYDKTMKMKTKTKMKCNPTVNYVSYMKISRVSKQTMNSHGEIAAILS